MAYLLSPMLSSLTGGFHADKFEATEQCLAENNRSLFWRCWLPYHWKTCRRRRAGNIYWRRDIFGEMMPSSV